ncbi:MAG: hypothetical protein AAGF11_43965 [Myxococcota bacterium]
MSLRPLAAACLACATLAGCDPTGDDVVGPEGGVVVSRDGRLTLDIPAGALDEPVEILIEEAERLPDSALGPAYAVLPAGTVFNAPVHVIYDYDAAGMDVSPDDITLVVEHTDDWRELADRHVFASERIIAASALYLSTFCVIEEG